MVTMHQFFLAFPLLFWSLQGIFSCLHCDHRFLDSVATLLKETLPVNISGRDTLIERHIQALADLHGTFLQNNYERVLDVRGIMSLKADIVNRLREIKKQQWKGVFIWQLSMYNLRVSLQKQMKQTLEQFADLACSEDCTVIEGPALDCWTCLRIAAQCFDGELCGGATFLQGVTWAAHCSTSARVIGIVEDRRIAEHKEINLYIFLVCESVLLSSVMLVYLVCFKHKKKMLQKALAS